MRFVYCGVSMMCLVIASVNASPLNEVQSRPDYEWRGQLTYIQQRKPAFNAPYSGEKSLQPEREKSYSSSATAYFGRRLSDYTDMYLNGEVVSGVPFSNLNGLAAVPNYELQKASGSNPIGYLSRAFVRHTWQDENSASSVVEGGLNQLPTIAHHRRLVLTAGKLAVSDIFDGNTYAKDGRRDFMNWVSLAHGAYDFAADVRGYSLGAVVEYYHDDWVWRIGRFLVPRESNGLILDYRVMRHYGDQVEVEHQHTVAGHAGKMRVLLFRNRAVMADFEILLVDAKGGVPTLSDQSRRLQSKVGVAISGEQSIGEDMGLFARLSWNDGKTETYSFTEVEQSLSAGMVMQGQRWGRPHDTVGVAMVQNRLSASHRAYLSAGGLGVFIGDGQLSAYQPERLFESYYSLAIAPAVWLSANWQRIHNPAYNAARGPVNIIGMRLHSEF
jgi:high affinity Mn2+ porin